MFETPKVGGIDLYSTPEGLETANKVFQSNKEKIDSMLERGLIKESDLSSLKVLEENLKSLMPNGFSPIIAVKMPLVGKNILKYNKEAAELIKDKWREEDLAAA